MSASVASSIAPLAHHEGAHGAVRHLRADVEHPSHPLERVEVLGKVSQPQSMPVGERRAGNVLDALHELDEEVLFPG